MNRIFNLLLLHNNLDFHPRSWICVSGKKLPNLINSLEKTVLIKESICREELSRRLSKDLGCSHPSFKMIFQGKREFIPIPVILKMSEYANDKKILKEINQNISYLKVNSASSKPVKAIKNLNTNLSKFLGSFMADGSMSIQLVFAAKEKKELDGIKAVLLKNKCSFSENYSKTRNQFCLNINRNRTNNKIIDSLLGNAKMSQSHYTIELSEAYKDTVLFFKSLIDKEFEAKPVSFKRRENMWRIIYSNKVMARYLIIFFSIWPGKKSDEAFEPEIIKESNLKIRKAFALGLLTFDGCVTKQGKMTFSSNSKKLIESIAEIWKKDNIGFGITKSHEKQYVINAYLKNKKEKLLEYFEPKTQKWKLIHWLAGNLNAKPIIKDSPVTKISEERILKLLRKVKKCDIVFLTKHFNCGQSTARYYLKTLLNQKKISLSNKTKSLNPKNVSGKTTVSLNEKYHKKLFDAIKRNFVYDKEFANALEIKKATLSAWKKRKSRIPIKTLEKMCNILNFNLQEFCNNLVKEDREIASIL